MDDLKQQIEVLLFWTDEPISLNKIMSILQIDRQLIKASLTELIQEYLDRNSGLEIAYLNHGYILQPAEKYNSLADQILPIDLKAHISRTLALIAMKEPVLQSEIVQVRGAIAYDHIKELLKLKLISKSKDPNGASFILKTTLECRQQFELTDQSPQQQYQKV